MSTIGAKIKKIREIKGLTQEDMADKLGMSPQGYGKLERDEADIPFSRLEQIANAFNLKVEDVTAFDERFVFNNYASNQANQGYIVNHINEKERELYEKNIKLLEDKIQYLTEQLNKKN
ncbi:MAG TPA: helix-turn-helix transcriptional regulator [Cytophagaceae bacterium]|jgi:transcriptional regulator with XRE-family HTH domain|nr:helix-turn-helix transcriptional regulator [Cytophagaceae bacterium]